MDLISRQAAIDALGEEPLVWHEDDAGEIAERNQWRRDVSAIKALPSAQKTGKWLEDKTGCVYWICSCCEFPSEASCANIFYRFCPRCGARMEGVE